MSIYKSNSIFHRLDLAREFALTQAGLTLLTFCQRVEGNLEAVVSDLDGAFGSIRRRLRIGTALSIGFGPLVDVCTSNSQSKELP